jgi:hypothetical protein
MLERNGFGHDVEGALDEETRENYLRMEEYAYRMRQQHHPGAAPGEFVGTPEDLEAIMKLMKKTLGRCKTMSWSARGMSPPGSQAVT